MKRIVGILGWLGVVLVLAAVAARLGYLGDERRLLSQPLAIAGLVITALYAISQWRDIGRSFQGRNTKYGTVAATSVLVFLAILVGINWISNRQNKRWDLTNAKQFSMSDQTRQIVTGLKQPVKVRVFYGGPVGTQETKDVLDEYAYLNKLVQVEYIDAVQNPLPAQQAGITMVPTILLEYGGRTERVTRTDEQALTNGLKKIIEGQARKMYFAQGHDERDPDDQQTPAGYAAFVAALKDDNIEVAKLSLAQVRQIPDDATMIVVAGPTSDYLPPEIDLMRGFLTRGGKVWLMLDPPEKKDPPLTNLIAFAKEWGIDVGTNLVYDGSGLGSAGPYVPIAMPAKNGHPITKNFRKYTAFPVARSVAPIEGGSGPRVAQRVIETSAEAWAESDLKTLLDAGTSQPPKPTLNAASGDKPGPVSIIAAVSAPGTDAGTPIVSGARSETRLVVAGDSDFCGNQFVGQVGNRDLALNIANWLAQQEDLIAIRPRAPDDRRLELTPTQGQMVFYTTQFVLPLLLVGMAIVVWARRR